MECSYKKNECSKGLAGKVTDSYRIESVMCYSQGFQSHRIARNFAMRFFCKNCDAIFLRCDFSQILRCDFFAIAIFFLRLLCDFCDAIAMRFLRFFLQFDQNM